MKILSVFYIIFLSINSIFSQAFSYQDEKIQLKLLSYDLKNFIIEIEHFKDWHTYWENPGDSGLPMSIVPEDQSIKIEKIIFPIPKRHEAKDALGKSITFVYFGKSRIFFSTNKMTKKFTLRWLICDKEVCVPGNTNLIAEKNVSQSDFNDKLSVFPSTYSNYSVEVIKKKNHFVEIILNAKLPIENGIEIFPLSKNLISINKPILAKKEKNKIKFLAKIIDYEQNIDQIKNLELLIIAKNKNSKDTGIYLTK